MQREKGAVFERSIAAKLRAAFPGAVVRRSMQADRAYEGDVVVEPPVPSAIGRVWWECHDAANPRPLDKLAQAEHDTHGTNALPVVVWHRKGARSTRATLRLGTLLALVGSPPWWMARGPGAIDTVAAVVELDLVDLLTRMADAARSGMIGDWRIEPVQTSAHEVAP